MGWLELVSFALVLALLAGGLVLLGGAVLLRLRQAAMAPPPPALPADPQTLAEGLASLATVRAEWRAYQKQLDEYLEAIEDQADVVDRRRRRAVSVEHRNKAKEETAAVPENAIEVLRARARANGLPV